MTEVVNLKFTEYAKMHGLLASRGAPKHLLSRDAVVPASVLETCTHKRYKAVSPKDQMEGFVRCLQNPTSGPYWLVIGSRDDDDSAQQCALGVMLAAMRQHLEKPYAIGRPLYHSVYGGVNSFGGTFDRLRDSETYRGHVGRIGLLVLANVVANSTREKLEKVRDLLHMYETLPRVLVVSGEDPLAFAVEALHMRPSRVLFLGKPEKQTYSQV